jgi:prevent-host-death family protein
MCYHVYMKKRKRLGVRAMRQSLSVYLRRVDAGESFEVTARGRPVAVLAPIEAGASPIERLVAAGRARMPEGDVLELGAPPKAAPSRRLSRALREERADRL